MTLRIIRSGQTVCWLALRRLSGDVSEIVYVKTLPEHRRQGHATALVKRAQQRTHALVAFLEPDGTGPTRAEEQAWLGQLGFKPGRYDFGLLRPNVKPVMIWRKQRL